MFFLDFLKKMPEFIDLKGKTCDASALTQSQNFVRGRYREDRGDITHLILF